MTIIKRRRNIERPMGLGRVFKENVQIADVHYKLTVDQEIIVTKTLSNTDEAEGQIVTTGKIFLLDEETDLIDSQIYILELVDGRQWHFYAVSGDPIAGFSAMSSDGMGLTSHFVRKLH